MFEVFVFWLAAVFALCMALAALWIAFAAYRNILQGVQNVAALNKLAEDLQERYGAMREKAEMLEAQNEHLRQMQAKGKKRRRRCWKR